jgi:hypothetical protein
MYQIYLRFKCMEVFANAGKKVLLYVTEQQKDKFQLKYVVNKHKYVSYGYLETTW